MPFVCVKFSRKKKKKYEITPDNLIHYTTQIWVREMFPNSIFLRLMDK